MPVVSMLAFPVPQLDYAYYADDYHGLFARSSADRVTLGGNGGSGGGEGLLFLETAIGERIPAVYIKTPKAKLTIIYSHGNGEVTLTLAPNHDSNPDLNPDILTVATTLTRTPTLTLTQDIGLLLQEMDELAKSTNTNVLIYEYVGYSLSRLEGAIPTEAGCYRWVPQERLSCMFSLRNMRPSKHTRGDRTHRDKPPQPLTVARLPSSLPSPPVLFCRAGRSTRRGDS